MDERHRAPPPAKKYTTLAALKITGVIGGVTELISRTVQPLQHTVAADRVQVRRVQRFSGQKEAASSSATSRSRRFKRLHFTGS